MTNTPQPPSIVPGIQRVNVRPQFLWPPQLCHPGIYQACVCVTTHFPVCSNVHTDTKACWYKVITGTTIFISGIGVELFKLMDGIHPFIKYPFIIYPFFFIILFLIFLIIYIIANTLLPTLGFLLFLFYGQRGRHHVWGGVHGVSGLRPLLQPYQTHPAISSHITWPSGDLACDHCITSVVHRFRQNPSWLPPVWASDSLRT